MSIRELLRKRKTIILKEPLIKKLLSQKSKEQTWESWESCRREFLRTAETPSVVEAGIKPLVDAINKHPYLVTIASCEGHEERGEEYTHAYVTFLIKEGYASKVIPKLKEITKNKPVAFQDTYEEERIWKPYLCPQSERYMSIIIPNPVKKKMIPLLAKEFIGFVI